MCKMVSCFTLFVQDVMRALVEGGADVRAVDEQGLSALLNAVKVGRLASNV